MFSVLRGIDMDAPDAAAIFERVRDLAIACQLVHIDDLSHLRKQLALPGVGIALGRDLAITLRPFGLQLRGIHLVDIDWLCTLGMALLVLLTHHLGELALLGQARLEQLVLQGTSHGTQWPPLTFAGLPPPGTIVRVTCDGCAAS